MNHKVDSIQQTIKTSVSVIFRNSEIAKKYQKRIEEFLDELLVGGDDFFCNVIKDEKCDIISKRKSVKKELIKNNVNGSQSPQAPLYDSVFNDTLEYSEEIKELIDPETESQKMTCFNCLGDHHLIDCPEDHVASRIATNKRAVLENTQISIRYHTDAQPLEKNGNICPGRISINLRNALDLQPNQLPLYIYRMRILGYPPGWMKEAEVEHSGLSLYDSNGKAAPFVDESSNKDNSKKFNGINFIEFPGFNTPVPDGYIDEWKKLNMLPMQGHQQLSEALKHVCVMNSPNYKKRKNNQGQAPDPDDNIKKKKEDGEERKQSEESPMKSEVNNDTSADERPSVVVGSPLIDTGNPYKRLPDCSKFSADITEHLPYENLPDAVGAYDRKMRGVLDQVRLDMNKLLEKSPPK